MFRPVESMSYEEYQPLLEEYVRRAENLRSEMLTKVVTVESGDRMVRVTAGPFGQVTAIKIAPHALRRMGAERLSATVLATVQEAVGQAGQAVLDLISLGLDDS